MSLYEYQAPLSLKSSLVMGMFQFERTSAIYPQFFNLDRLTKLAIQNYKALNSLDQQQSTKFYLNILKCAVVGRRAGETSYESCKPNRLTFLTMLDFLIRLKEVLLETSFNQ